MAPFANPIRKINTLTLLVMRLLYLLVSLAALAVAADYDWKLNIFTQYRWCKPGVINNDHVEDSAQGFGNTRCTTIGYDDVSLRQPLSPPISLPITIPLPSLPSPFPPVLILATTLTFFHHCKTYVTRLTPRRPAPNALLLPVRHGQRPPQLRATHLSRQEMYGLGRQFIPPSSELGPVLDRQPTGALILRHQLLGSAKCSTLCGGTEGRDLAVDVRVACFHVFIYLPSIL